MRLYELFERKNDSKPHLSSSEKKWQNIGFDVRSDTIWPSLIFKNVNQSEYKNFDTWLSKQRQSQNVPHIKSTCILSMVVHMGDMITIFYGDAEYIDQDHENYYLFNGRSEHKYSKNNQIVFDSEESFEQFLVALTLTYKDSNTNINVERHKVIESWSQKYERKNDDTDYKPRIRKYVDKRGDTYYEVLGSNGLRVPGQGTHGFTDRKSAKELLDTIKEDSSSDKKHWMVTYISKGKDDPEYKYYKTDTDALHDSAKLQRKGHTVIGIPVQVTDKTKFKSLEEGDSPDKVWMIEYVTNTDKRKAASHRQIIRLYYAHEKDSRDTIKELTGTGAEIYLYPIQISSKGIPPNLIRQKK